MRTTSRVFGFLTLGLVACATSFSEDELDSELRRIAASTPEVRSEAKVVSVHASSEMEAWSLVAQSIGEGPSGQARVLGRAFSDGASQPVDLIVGGPYGALTKRLVLDAFSLVREPSLPGLTLVFVGPEDAAADVRPAAQNLGVTFLHREFSD